MNKAETEAAFAIISPPGLNSTPITWNAAGTVLTVTLPSPLPYGTEVRWQVSTHARDIAGNPLISDSLNQFRIIQLGTSIFNFDPPTSGSVSAPSFFRFNHLYNITFLGDGDNNHSHRLFLGFSLAGLPENLTTIQKASLRWWTSVERGAPFGMLGSLVIEPVNIGEQLEISHNGDNPQLIADYQTPALSTGLVLPPSAVGRPGVIDVTSMVQRDWEQRSVRNHRTQYRLRFTNTTNGNNSADALISGAEVDPNLASLELTYEYP